MTFDEFAFLFKQQESAIEQLIKLDSEVKKAKGDEKKEKEAQAEGIRNELIKSDPPLWYHGLAVLSKDSANNLRSTWAMKNRLVEIPDPKWSGWNNICNPTFNLSILPKYSFAIQFNFRLAKPYISKDEQEFYIIDNPIRKEKIFGLPFVAPSSWKGSLRSALWQLGYNEKNEHIQRLFGNERDTEDESSFQKGRLHLYPTFFNKKSLEVINPHDREKRTGSKPIYFESVPIDSKGVFSLLCIPFDKLGEEIPHQTTSDLKLLCEGLHAMFMVYGFGAKTSSGFGTAESGLTDGKIILKVKNIETSKKEEVQIQPPDKSFEKYLNVDGSVKEKFKGSGEADLLSNDKYGKMKQQLGGGNFSEFKRFRHWYGQYSEQWQKHLQSKSAPKPEWPTWTFKNFDELLKQSEEIRSLFVRKGDESQ